MLIENQLFAKKEHILKLFLWKTDKRNPGESFPAIAHDDSAL